MAGARPRIALAALGAALGIYALALAIWDPDALALPTVVHVAIGETTMNFTDTAQVLNTHGVDSSGCPDTGTRNDESEHWQQLPGG